MRRVMFESDANGIELVSVAIYSVLRNADPSRPVEILLAHDDSFLAAGGREKLEAIVARFPHDSIRFSNFMPIYLPLASRLEREDTRWPPMVWGWVFADRLFPDVEGKLVYIDLDTYTTGDLQPLFDVDLKSGNHLMAMVAESVRPDDDFCGVKWTTSDKALYNTGVIVLDLDAWRREDMAMKIVDWFAAHKAEVPFVEQDAANFVCQDRVLRLPLKWNYNDNNLRYLKRVDIAGGSLWENLHPPREALEAMAYPRIIHYMFTHKPNRYNHRPERQVFKRAMRELGLIGWCLPGENLYRALEGWLYDLRYNRLRLLARRKFAQLPVEYIDRVTGKKMVESVMGDKALRFAYETLLGRSLWPVLFGSGFISALMGRRYDSPRSKSAIASLASIPGCRASEAALPLTEYASFNEFFTRRLKPGSRPLGEGVVSPADGRLRLYLDADASSPFPLKGACRSLKTVFGGFDGRYDVAVFRLAPVDYHRFHFPCDCEVVSPVQVIAGKYHSVNPIALLKYPDAYADNERQIVQCSTAFGPMWLVDVGAFGVGTIVQTFSGAKHCRGDEKGYFKFGGSTVIMVTRAGALEFAADLVRNSRLGLETRVLALESIAVPR